MAACQDMNALLITGPAALEVSRLAVPQARPGEIVVRTAFVGICGTDVHLHAGHSFYLEHGFLSYPFVFGHEYTGTVSAIGEGVTAVAVGSRVVGHCMVPCQRCDNCQRGRRHLCRHLKEVGLRFIQGAAADYVAVPDYAVTIVPDGLSLRAAALTEPTVTAYHACERTAIGKADNVAVIGTGTLGLLSLLVARLTARTVDVIGVADSELGFALELGADRALHPDEAPRDAYDVVIEASGVGSAFELAVDIAALGGRLAMVGLPGSPSRNVSQTAIALKDLTVHGILHGLDYYGLTLDLFRQGKIDPLSIVAQVGGIEEAGAMFGRTTADGRRQPKYLIEFAGEPDGTSR